MTGPDPAGVVHLASASVEVLAAASDSRLSAAEEQRLAGLSSPSRRRQFVAGRRLARSLLNEVFGAQDWVLSAAGGAPPRVENRPSLHLSLAHSADRVVCAVGDTPLGVDVEHPRSRRDLDGLIAMACDAQERKQLAALGPAARQDAFHALWTLKEAWFKSRARAGWGLAELLCANSRTCHDAQTANGWVWLGPSAVTALVAPPGITPLWHGTAPAARPSRWHTTGARPPG